VILDGTGMKPQSILVPLIVVLGGLSWFTNLAWNASVLSKQTFPTLGQNPALTGLRLLDEANALPRNDKVVETHHLMPGKPSVVPLEIVSSPDSFTRLQRRNLAIASSRDTPISIYIYPLHLPDKESYLVDELKHFVYDGLMHSPFMNITTNPDSAHLWIARPVAGEKSRRKWCLRFKDMLAKRNVLPPIILMDWYDGVTLVTCPELVSVINPQNLYYTKRGVVRDRYYNATTRRMEVGYIDSFTNWSIVSAAPIRHVPYAVRSDFVRALEHVLSKQTRTSMSLERSLVRLPRPKDAAHFWPVCCYGRKVDRGGKVSNSILRDSVSALLLELAQNDGLQTFADLSGIANVRGRNSVDLEYARDILKYKIVVVAQKDFHEEHYRLLEAIVSGAMVMSDVMLSIPRDFVDGESIVFYHDLDDLRTKIKYYLEHDAERLEIASKGWTLAWNRHRSWHRMEELVFGEIRSPAIP
jgi:Glycosyl transferases group 1